MAKPLTLVTGGAGFIGSHVTQELLRLGHDVLVVDDLSDGYLENVPAAAHFSKYSILDIAAIDMLFDVAPFDYVFHFAAYVTEHMSHYARHHCYATNVLGSINLINAAIRHHVKRFVYVSSMSVYNIDQMPALEDDVPKPADPYGIAKYAVEQDLQAAQAHFGLDYTILRPHNVYGPRCNLANPYRNVIAIFLRQCLNGEPMTIYGDGLQSRQFSYVEDIAPLFARAVCPEARNQIVNIGTQQAYTVQAVAETVARAVECSPRFTYLPARNEAKKLIAVHTRQNAILGEPAERPLDEALSRTARWAMNNRHLAPRPCTSIDLPEFVPEALRYG